MPCAKFVAAASRWRRLNCTLDPSLDEICRRIAEVAPGLHSAGTFSPRTFNAIARAAGNRTIHHSVETGSGASTLLFSHLSSHHTVFASDGGSGSVTNVRRSPSLRPNVVTFVEGPTQVTLPRHNFTEKLQLALIDGPHGYPFPDLEYYLLYPHLDAGALLILDDIHIPTVHNLFQFLRRDAMFELDRVVQTTAFFTRTDAPTFDPLGDGWWQQKYNSRPLLRYTWRDGIRNLVPGSTRRRLSRMKREISLGSPASAVQILAPQNGETVSDAGIVEGTATMPPDSYLWVLARRKDFDGWWPQGAGAVPVRGNRWSVSANFGGPQDAGCDFEIAALAVQPPTHELWTDWVARVKETGLFPPVQLPSPGFVLGEAFRSVRKRG
jgi:Methyltransferase domain